MIRLGLHKIHYQTQRNCLSKSQELGLHNRTSPRFALRSAAPAIKKAPARIRGLKLERHAATDAAPTHHPTFSLVIFHVLRRGSADCSVSLIQHLELRGLCVFEGFGSRADDPG